MSDFMGVCIILGTFVMVFIGVGSGADFGKPAQTMFSVFLGVVVVCAVIVLSVHSMSSSNADLLAIEASGTEIKLDSSTTSDGISPKTIILNLLKDNKTKEEICEIMDITEEEFDIVLGGL